MKYGIGCDIDEQRAIEKCLESEKKGNKMAKALRVFFGWEKPKNVEEAFLLFKEVYKKDEKFEKKETGLALFFLGRIYHLGTGKKVNLEKAIKFYKLAIKKFKNTSAMNNLGLIYHEGKNEKKYHKALKLYEEAIQHNHLYAMVNLGILHLFSLKIL